MPLPRKISVSTRGALRNPSRVAVVARSQFKSTLGGQRAGWARTDAPI